MPKVIDIQEALDRTQFLDNRDRETTAEEEDKAFATLSEYRDGGIFVGGFAGESPWERHPSGDEIVQVLVGETQLIIRLDQGDETFLLTKGQMIVVPKGQWHRFIAPNGVTLMTVTPKPTEVSADI